MDVRRALAPARAGDRGLHRPRPRGPPQGRTHLRLPHERRALDARLHPRPLSHRPRPRAGRLGEYHPAALELAADADVLSTTRSCSARSWRRQRLGARRRPSTPSSSADAPERERVVLFHHRPDRTDDGARRAGGALHRRAAGGRRPAGRASLRAVSSTGRRVARRGRRRLGAERPRRRAHPRPGGPACRGLRGSADARRRLPDRGADAAGFVHDVCSTVHPLLAASPFFRDDRELTGVRLLTPEVAFAHPLDGGRAAAVAGSVAETAPGSASDERAYRRLLGPLVGAGTTIVPPVLAPLARPARRPIVMARFGLVGLSPATRARARVLAHEEARALLAGLAPTRCGR